LVVCQVQRWWRAAIHLNNTWFPVTWHGATFEHSVDLCVLDNTCTSVQNSYKKCRIVPCVTHSSRWDTSTFFLPLE
jgi:hypothetical protein